MYRYLAGLQPAEPGYQRTLLQPRPGGGFRSARATHESLFGVHECAWRLEDERLVVEARVPPNTSATLLLPEGASLADSHEQRLELGPGRHVLDATYAARTIRA
jgi:alpha-L-rhamnosidase